MVGAVVVFAGLAPKREDYRLCFLGFVCVDVFLSFLVIGSSSGYVLGIHKNGIGASLAGGLLVCLEMWFSSTGWSKRFLFAAMVVITGALILTVSRGAWCGP